MAIVAFLELGHGDTNLGEVLEDTTVEDLFLQRPIESFGNTIGLRFGDEGKAWRDAPELDLVEDCLLYTSPSPRDRQKSRMPSSA